MGGIGIGVERGGMESPKIEAREGRSAKRGRRRGVGGNRLNGKEPPRWRKLTQRSESFRRWVAE